MNRQYCLSGGILLDLILDVREKNVFKDDKVTQVDILKELIRLLIPDFSPNENTFASNTNLYRKCEISEGKWLPFKKKKIADEYDLYVRSEYARALENMQQFVSRCLVFENRSGFNTLATNLIGLISLDESIRNTDTFYCSEKPITKKELCQMDAVDIPSLLLGVWHYIIMNRPDNYVGRNTFSALFYATGDAGSTYRMNDGLSRSCAHMVIGKCDIQKYSAANGPDITTSGTKTGYSDKALQAYLQKARVDFGMVKTLLYPNNRPFYDFYVQNDIDTSVSLNDSLDPLDRFNEMRHQHVPIALQFASVGNYLILRGDGGLGKSMMMNHLLLNTIDHYDEVHKIPVMIFLRFYREDTLDFTGFVYQAMKSVYRHILYDDFIKVLSGGNLLLLFDGFDEIKSCLRVQFEEQFSAFLCQYPDNMTVMSSRPVSSFTSFAKFRNIVLRPFTRKQSVQLIQKLEFRPDTPEIKDSFLELLSNQLFETHREFCQNPLLLTLMLMNYEVFAEVPTKMYLFFRETFVTLAKKHDSSKGAYQRSFETGMTTEEFSGFLSEFCARSYLKEQYNFTFEEIEYYYHLIKQKGDYKTDYTVQALITDLTQNLCIMQAQDARYHFIHRSFQEYFCALYFSWRSDKQLEMFNNELMKLSSRESSDSTIIMLYGMIQSRVEECIFLPYLRSLLTEDGEVIDFNHFMARNYPTFGFEIILFENMVDERLYVKIQKPLFALIACDILPKSTYPVGLKKEFLLSFPVIDPLIYPEFSRRECIELSSEELSSKGIPVSDLFLELKTGGLFSLSDDSIYETQPFYQRVALNHKNHSKDSDKKVPFSYFVTFDLKEILESPERFSNTLKALNDDNFLLKYHYSILVQYYKILTDKCRHSADSLFD